MRRVHLVAPQPVDDERDGIVGCNGAVEIQRLEQRAYVSGVARRSHVTLIDRVEILLDFLDQLLPQRKALCFWESQHVG